jgi:PadR family transcriptional regulator, regulatory protein PadR
MVNQPRLSSQTLKVLAAVLSSPRDGISGAEISRTTKLASGTLYPILLRLERARWLESWWEHEAPQELGRPRRRFYRVTALGAKKASVALRDLQTALRGLAWA